MARDIGLLILRLAGLYLALSHGLGKVTSLASGQGAGFIKATADMGFPMPAVFAWAAGGASGDRLLRRLASAVRSRFQRQTA